jgi:hypothetical protein
MRRKLETLRISDNHIFYTCLILVLAIAAFGLIVRH